MKPLLIAALLMALSACCSNPSTPPTVPRPLPVEAMAPAAPLPDPASPRLPDLVRWANTASDLYGECRTDKQALIDWINRND